MRRLRSPIRWYGGKYYMVKNLVPLLPPHITYVEVFGGGAQLLFAKPPSPVEVYNDIDSGLVNFFRVLRDPRKFKRFYRLVSLTPYSREEYYFCRATWQQCKDDVERAYRWFVAVRMSFAGANQSWGFVVSRSFRGMAGTVSSWLSIIEMLPEIHQRVMRVQIEHRDFRDIFPLYDTSETLFYCDPPYVPETRKLRKVYPHEMTLGDHKDLVAILLNIQGMALLSGYRHPVYDPLEQAGWKRLDFSIPCRSIGVTKAIVGKGIRTRPLRTESVWISPRAWERLFGCP